MSLSGFTFTTRARPFVELGVGDSRTDVGNAIWDGSHWDDPIDAHWAGTEPLWVDMTCESHGIETAVGHARSTDVFGPGTCSLTVSNATGWADPQRTGDEPPLLGLRPGRALRIGVDHNTLGRVVLWRGFVDETEPRFDPVHGSVVDISGIDALGEVGRVELGQLAAAVGAGELAQARMTRIPTAARWPATKRSLAATGVPLLGTALGPGRGPARPGR